VATVCSLHPARRSNCSSFSRIAVWPRKALPQSRRLIGMACHMVLHSCGDCHQSWIILFLYHRLNYLSSRLRLTSPPLSTLNWSGLMCSQPWPLAGSEFGFVL